MDGRRRRDDNNNDSDTDVTMTLMRWRQWRDVHDEYMKNNESKEEFTEDVLRMRTRLANQTRLSWVTSAVMRWLLMSFIPGCPFNLEFSNYLNYSVHEKPSLRAFKWWVQHAKIYPNLHWMALDYMNIPGLTAFFTIDWILYPQSCLQLSNAFSCRADNSYTSLTTWMFFP